MESLFLRRIYAEQVLSALLTAFWTVPFLLNIEGVSIGGFETDFTGFYLLDKLPLIIWTGLFGFLGYNYFSKKKVFSYLSTFLAFLTFFMFLGSRYASLRVYRFGLFFYMFLPLLFLSFFKLTNFSKNIFLVLTGLALIFSPSVAFNQRGNIGFEIDDVGEGRILVAASSNSQPTSLFYHHAVPMVSGNPGVKGLFVESSPNVPYFQALEGFVEPDTFLWANRPSRRSSRSPENLSDYLNFFGVNYVFHDSEDFLEDLNKFEEIDIQYYDGEFSLYSVGNTSYVEVFEGEMSSVESELWADEVDNWFYEGDFSKLLMEENISDAGYEPGFCTRHIVRDVEWVLKNFFYGEEVHGTAPWSQYFSEWKNFLKGKETVYQFRWYDPLPALATFYFLFVEFLKGVSPFHERRLV